MKKISFLILILSVLNGYSQNAKSKLDGVKTIEDAQRFVRENRDLVPEIYTLSPELDSLPRRYKGISEGDVIKEGANTIKIISIGKQSAFRVSYIFLDGSKKSVGDINKIRNQITNQYKKGIPFTDLAKKYTMDGNPTGELNWFTEGQMVPEFEKEVKEHKKGELFNIDIPARKWYYLTLKTFDDREVTKITVLKVKGN